MELSKQKQALLEQRLKEGTLVHLLIIRLSAMGDVAMVVPVLKALTAQYPTLKITILTRAFFKPMFSKIPNVTVYEADVKGKHKGVRGLYKLYKELKKLHIDGVADLHNVLRSNILKYCFKLGSIPFLQINKGREEKKALIDSKNTYFKALKTTHERYASVFKDLGFPVSLENTSLLPKEPLLEESIAIVGLDDKRWIGIAPFAAFKGKMYPLELMKEVIERLNNTQEYKILLFGGGEKEQQQLETIAKTLDSVVNIAGKLSFKEELSLISNLDVMLAMDSGNAHLAAMYAIPTVTLWGVTHPYSGFAPFRQEDNVLLADRNIYPQIPTSIYGNKFPKGYENVMDTISPAIVISKIITVLS